MKNTFLKSENKLFPVILIEIVTLIFFAVLTGFLFSKHYVGHTNTGFTITCESSLIVVFISLILNFLLLILSIIKCQKLIKDKLKSAINKKSIEIEERKKAENKILRSDNKYRKIENDLDKWAHVFEHAEWGVAV